MGRIVAGTGHRVEKCGDEDTVRTNIRVALRDSQADVVISGMANGFDLWLADEARLFGIEIWAARPWAGHKARKEDANLYATIIEHASKVVNVHEAVAYPGPACYHARNAWMVDHASHILAYWDGGESGGTYQCLMYNRRTDKKPVRNIYE